MDGLMMDGANSSGKGLDIDECQQVNHCITLLYLL